MAEETSAAVCLCPNCFHYADAPGNCPVCGHALLVCRPGDPDDPCRRPLVAASGEVLTQAPLWWLLHSVGEIARLAAKRAKGEQVAAGEAQPVRGAMP